MNHRKPFPKNKNPHHLSALRLNDLQPGKEVIIVHTGGRRTRHYDPHDGDYITRKSREQVTVLTAPFIGYTGRTGRRRPLYYGEPKTLVVTVRTETGRAGNRCVVSMGVASRYGVWDAYNFTVAADKAHLL